MNHSPLAAGIRLVGEEDVKRLLRVESCIPIVRNAMCALSAGETHQLLRTFIALGDERIFGIMPGALSATGYFGAKLVSVFDDPPGSGRSAHRGVVVLFEASEGRPVCVADAEQVTLLRTAAASAVATESLARSDACVLAILGSGHQAVAHASAMAAVRPLRSIVLWSRSAERARRAVSLIVENTGIETFVAETIQAAVADAHIICTTTSSKEPILRGEWVRPGSHVNLVGASGANAAEADAELIRRSLYFVDSRESALVQAGEFLNARRLGLVDESHIRGEIGEVLLGRKPGRPDSIAVTVYKSLGHAVQDLATAAYLYEQAGKANGC